MSLFGSRFEKKYKILAPVCNAMIVSCVMGIVIVRPPQKMIAKLTNIQHKQVPFATVLALTKVAGEYRNEAEMHANTVFNIKRHWAKKSMKYGFKVRPATKSDRKATVFSNAPFLKEHEGARRRTPSGKHFTVPTKAVKNARGLVIKSRKPLRLSSKNTFKERTTTGKMGLFERKGKKKKLLYVFVKDAKLPKDLEFKKRGRRYFRKHFARVFSTAIKHALDTAR